MEYKIRKSTYQCARCEREVEVTSPYYSVLQLEENEPTRTDYCVACFEGGELQLDPAETAFWRTRRIEGEASRRAIDFVTLRELFFRMADHPGEEYRKICYLVALVLIRKRLLKLGEFTTEDGVDYLVVTTKLRPEPLRLEAPELHQSEFADLREKLTLLLDLDFDEEDGDSSLPTMSLDEEDDELPGEPGEGDAEGAERAEG